MNEPPIDPSQPGPLDRATAVRLLERGDELLEQAEFERAGAHYRRVVGFPDPAITAAAMYGLGESLFRLDQEDAAVGQWELVTQLPETPFTYLAWRQIAASRVRAGELPGARRAYLEAEQRAPEEDRAEIASRLGWIAKETGDSSSARRYFARSRGGEGAPILTFLIMGVTVAITLAAGFPPRTTELFDLLLLDKFGVAAGEYWRLITVTLLHGSIIHLLFNMYALYLAGSLVEQLYGWKLMGFMYVLTGVAASVASFVFGGDAPAVGASGAVFGLFGVLLASSRIHNPIVDRRRRAVLAQIGGLIVLNLIFGFGAAGVGVPIDNAAHVGGLLAGLWLGFLIVPGRVPTLSRMWQRPAGTPGGPVERSAPVLLRIAGVLALVIVIGLGLVVGTNARTAGVPGPGAAAGVASDRSPARA